MLNVKKYMFTLLTSDAELTELLGEGHIVSAYPQEVKTFPLIVYEDSGQRDVEFSDNLPAGTDASVRIHIFSKTLTDYPTTLTDYPTTAEIGSLVHRIMRADFWACTLNTETSDVSDNIRHRIMDFKRAFLKI